MLAPANSRSLHEPDDSRSGSSGLVGMTVDDLSPRPSGPRASKGVNELQFKIKDQDYFLAFVEQEKRWYVVVPTAEGVHRIPVYVDAVNWGMPAALESEAHI